MTFGGGTNEIQRDIIGYVGLGLPPRRGADHGLPVHPEQDDAAELAASILRDRTTNDRLKAVRGRGRPLRPRPVGGPRRRPACWASRSPRSTTAPGSASSGLGRILVEIGRVVAPVPPRRARAGVQLVAEVGSEEQRAAWLPGAATGAVVLTAALAEERSWAPARPTTAAAPEGEGFRLTGSKAVVPAARTPTPSSSQPRPDRDRRVPGRAADAGVTVVPSAATSTSTPSLVSTSTVSSCPPTGSSGPDGAAADRLRQLVVLAGAAEQLGITEGRCG